MKRRIYTATPPEGKGIIAVNNRRGRSEFLMSDWTRTARKRSGENQEIENWSLRICYWSLKSSNDK
jgi:hypothetical protein